MTHDITIVPPAATTATSEAFAHVLVWSDDGMDAAKRYIRGLGLRPRMIGRRSVRAEGVSLTCRVVVGEPADGGLS